MRVSRDAVAKKADRKIVLAFMEKSNEAAGTGRKLNAGEAASKADFGGKKVSGGADSGSTSGKTAENATVGKSNASAEALIKGLTSAQIAQVDELVASGYPLESKEYQQRNIRE